MIRHVVVLSFSEGCTREQHAEMLAMLRRLDTEVPEVRALAVGPHLADDGPTPALALVVDVEDREALARYTTNPFHLSVGAFFGPIKGTAAIVDFELG